MQDQSYCDTNGFKQEVKCILRGTNGTLRSDHYITFQTCPNDAGDFANFLRFEVCADSSSLCARFASVHTLIRNALSCLQLLVMICIGICFPYVQRRKRRLLTIQQRRIATYL